MENKQTGRRLTEVLKSAEDSVEELQRIAKWFSTDSGESQSTITAMKDLCASCLDIICLSNYAGMYGDLAELCETIVYVHGSEVLPLWVANLEQEDCSDDDCPEASREYAIARGALVKRFSDEFFILREAYHRKTNEYLKTKVELPMNTNN